MDQLLLIILQNLELQSERKIIIQRYNFMIARSKMKPHGLYEFVRYVCCIVIVDIRVNNITEWRGVDRGFRECRTQTEGCVVASPSVDIRGG